MDTEQTDIMERMRNRAQGRIVNALNALKSELASQGHDTTALTLEAVMAIIERKQVQTEVIAGQTLVTADVTLGKHHPLSDPHERRNNGHRTRSNQTD